MTEEQEDESYEEYAKELNQAKTIDPDSWFDDEDHHPHEFDGCVPNQ